MKQSIRLLMLITTLIALLAACASPTQTPTGDGTPEAIYTAAAQTVMAQLTLEAGEAAVARLTQIALQPTNTPLPPTPVFPTANFTLTAPPAPTATQAPPVRCDWVELVGDVTSTAGVTFTPGSVFTKVWRVRNIGSCEWTLNYALVLTAGSAMNAPAEVFLPVNVRPGETVDLFVTLTAPPTPGVYRGDWLLRNPSGGFFGTGANALQPLTVQLQVAQGTIAARGSFDFVARACEAIWRSATAALGCPGSVNDSNGSVVALESPYLESRLEDEPALWLRPNSSASGVISGIYPVYVVRSGDRFRAEVGCMRGSPNCDLVFSLNYRLTNGGTYNLGTWREVYDGRTSSIDIDLSALAGETLQFILGVENRGSTNDANGFWFVPHILSGAPQTNVVLRWNQQGGEDDICRELTIIQMGRSSATARARSCRDAGRDLGSSGLTSEELDQLLVWQGQLDSFDAELFDAEGSEPITAFLTFTGNGAGEATNVHITAISNFAERLFRRVSR